MRRGTVLLDLDDTCMPDLQASRAAIAMMHRELGRSDTTVDETLEYARSRWYAGPFHDYCLKVGISSWEGLWLAGSTFAPTGFPEWVQTYQVDVWASAAQRACPTTRTIGLHTRYIEIRNSFVVPYPGVREAVSALADQHAVWFITNGDSELQRRKIRLGGLQRFADSIFVSGELGVSKPHAGFYDHVEAQLAQAPTHVHLVIGDSLEKDIAPAAARGWPSIWIGGDREAPNVRTLPTLGALEADRL